MGEIFLFITLGSGGVGSTGNFEGVTGGGDSRSTGAMFEKSGLDLFTAGVASGLFFQPCRRGMTSSGVMADAEDAGDRGLIGTGRRLIISTSGLCRGLRLKLRRLGEGLRLKLLRLPGDTLILLGLLDLRRP